MRVGHTFVVGTTRVGKTRLASILINQNIRNGEAVIVVDPKGDTELVADIKRACDASGRLDDFKIVHLGFPEESAHYNPLKNYHQVSEVASRITDAITAEGEGKQFAAFAWKYVNIVALCLEEMEEAISYQSIAFYITRLDLLLMQYADSTFPQMDPDYEQKLEDILSEHNKKVAKSKKGMKTFERHHGVIEYVRKHINENITQGNTESLFQQVLIELFDAAVIDKQYYDKITASVGPVLSEINKSNAATILSSPYQSGDIELMQVIKQRKVLYIGLDSLTNPNIAQAVGKAFLSDLVSTAGKIYKEDGPKTTLSLHCDELSEIV